MKKVLIILILISYSCSNKELSRELAKEKISVYFNMPCVETVNFQNMTLGKNIIPPKYNEMISNDLLTFDREKSWNTSVSYTHLDVYKRQHLNWAVYNSIFIGEKIIISFM